MRILFVTDARSPISQNWIKYFLKPENEVYIASTFDCDLDLPINGFEFTPVAFSSAKKKSSAPSSASSLTLSLRTALRQWLGPLTLRYSAKKLRKYIQEIKPDLIHAMRIPYEGMLTAVAVFGGRVVMSEANDVSRPLLIVSVWGNDFTLHASSTSLMTGITKLVMQNVDALHADTQRDIKLAREYGLSEDKLTLVTPGNGGIRSYIFYPPSELVKNPIIINPRGVRPYVRNDSFFKAIPLVLEKFPQAKFICTSMQNESQALKWIEELNISSAVELLPAIEYQKMGDLFRSAQIVVSPSIHDGTPNSLIEAMACGCFPVAGDLESIREWITHGQNGLLFDSNNPQSIAESILLGLEREDLRQDAASLNAKLISAKAEYEVNMKKVQEFYNSVMRKT
ncbi:MAG: putative glycosyltransferase [Chloroflexi bacterium OLB14]|nr:MAG: putative glycosyltransferase [Chloroflexi bacterium OLB14]